MHSFVSLGSLSFWVCSFCLSVRGSCGSFFSEVTVLVRARDVLFSDFRTVLKEGVEERGLIREDVEVLLARVDPSSSERRHVR